MTLPPALVTSLAVVLISFRPLAGQSLSGPPVPQGSPSPPSPTLTLRGKVVSLEGEPLPGATVWVQPFSPGLPAQAGSSPLAESHANETGEFALEVNLPAEAGLPAQAGPTRMVVLASHPRYNKAVDFFTLDGHSSVPTFTLRLKSLEITFEEPDLDLVDAWLLPRIGRRHPCYHHGGQGCEAFRAAMVRYQKGQETRQALDPSDESTLAVQAGLPWQVGPLPPEARLLGALALMRIGAWPAAEKTLALLVREFPDLPEAWFEQGVLFNFVHRPREATQALTRAQGDLPRAPLVDLELGRAAFQEEKWEAAEENLTAALTDRSLRPPARYLRARALMNQGSIEAASREAAALMRETGRKPLPAAVHAFVVDVKRRLEEESLQSITSVMAQPVPELVKLVLPLRGVDPSAPPPPGGLESLLKHVGQVVEKFFRDFTNTSATEILWQTRLDKNGRPVESRNEEFYYVFLSRSEQGRWWVEEYRGDRKGSPSSPGGLEAGYMATSGFASSLVVFHSKFQPGMVYRYLGRQKVGDQEAYVVGFAQRPGVSAPLGFFNISQSKTAQLYLQGIAWISAEQHEVIRMRTDLLGPVPEVQLKRETAEVDYRPYRFVSSPRAFWLPNRVSVSVEWGGKRLRNEHIFSQYRLFKVDTEERKPKGSVPGQALGFRPQ